MLLLLRGHKISPNKEDGKYQPTARELSHPAILILENTAQERPVDVKPVAVADESQLLKFAHE